jgi:hypothetical protein
VAVTDHDTLDVIDRARQEVSLLVRQYQRRLKEAAENFAKADLLLNGMAGRSAEEVGREAFAKAGAELGLISGEEARPALSGPTT